MKVIKSVPMWNNGKSIEATLLNACAINVSLGEYASFWWSILDADFNQLQQGNVTMNGDEYTKWGSNDSYAWDFVAKSLNLTIVGDYVPPVVETPIVETPIVETPSEEIITE